MNSSQISIMSGVLLLAVANAVRADVMVDSFETAPAAYGTPANPPYTSVGQTSLWASEGSQSLAITFDNSQAWSWIYAAGPSGGNSFPRETYEDWYNHTKFQFDLYRPALDLSPSSGWNLDLRIAMSGTQGWAEYGVVSYVWLNNGLTSSQTITVDYSAARDAAPAPTTAPPPWDWWQLAFMARGSYGGTVYIDNLRFVEPVPEPASLGLIVLGMAMLGLRRLR